MTLLKGGNMAQLGAIFAFIIALFLSSYSNAEDISLTVEEFDPVRNSASLLVVDTSQVPLGTILRVHSKTGTCEVKITERVNDHLIGTTKGCEAGIITPGMKLAYSTPNSWERETASNFEPTTEENQTSTSYSSNDILDEIMERTTFFLGHNFAGQLEGNVYANGLVKDLDGDSAFSLGIKGRIYDFTDRISLSAELGYETPRTLDQATYTDVTTGATSVAGTNGFSPRVTLWSLAVMGDARVLDRVNAFLGMNLSLPSVRNSPFKLSGDIGFQGGANYQLYKNIAIEGLIKISNMNLRNNFGEVTDVSLAGLELRGRYNF